MEFSDFRNIKNKKTTFLASLDTLKAPQESLYNPSLHGAKTDNVSLGNTFLQDTKALLDELELVKSQQGLVGKLWDGFKNLTNIGAGSKKVEIAIKQLQNGEINKSEAKEKLELYKDGQKTCLDVVADMFSSIFAIGIFAATVPTGALGLGFGLCLSTLSAGTIKVGLKGIDSKLNDREYSAKNAIYDVVTGGINGLFAPVTNGLGSSLTKTIGCKLGLEIGGDIVGQGAKTTLKNLIVNQSIDVTGGNIAKRAAALGAGMALDGALGGSADNTTRAILEGKDAKDVAKSSLSGFLGGLIFSPIIGAGFRVASKLGQGAGKKIFKKNPVLNIDKTNNNTPVFVNDGQNTSFRGKKEIEIKSLQEIKADTPVVKPAFSCDVIENLEKSFNAIPQEKEQRVNFLMDFFQTDLKTGEKTLYNETSAEFASIQNEAMRLAKYDDDKIRLALEHSLKMSQINNVNVPYGYLAAYLDIYPDLYGKIKERNIYEIFEKRNKIFPNGEKTAIEDVIALGNLSDSEYKSIYDLIQKAGFCDERIRLSDLIPFSRNIDKNLVEYMCENDLFNLDNVQGVRNGFELYHVFRRLDRGSVEKMHKRGLLVQIPERGSCLNINDAIFLVQELDNEQWQNAAKRRLFSLKNADEKYLNVSDICTLAQMDDETYLNVKSRDLVKKTGSRVVNVRTLAELSDEDWQKFTQRGLDASQPNLSNPQNLINLLNISEGDWKIAQARGLKFANNDDFKLLELSDEQWQNFVKRNLNSPNVKYTTDSKAAIAQLSDIEYENAKKRGLIKENSFRENQEFSAQDVLLAKCSDEEYSLYFKRGLDKKDYDAQIKEKLLRMDDKHFTRANEEIIPYLYPPQNRLLWQFSSFNSDEFLELVYLDDEAYKTILELMALNNVVRSRFSLKELKTISKLKPDQIERLKNLYSAPMHSIWKRYDKSVFLDLALLNNDEFTMVENALCCFSVGQTEGYLKRGNMAKICSSQAFIENRDLIAKINNSNLDYETGNILTDIVLKTNDYDFGEMSLKQKMEYIGALEKVQNQNVFTQKEKQQLHLEDKIRECKELVHNVIFPTEVSKDDNLKMMKGFFANNNPKLEQLLSSTQFEKFSKDGLALTYSRKSFLSDLTSVLKELSQDEQNAIFNKLGIKPVLDGKNIIGYDGIINLGKLSKDGTEGKALNLATKFIKENSIVTGEKDLDEALNSLICAMPEFINIIGKQQHIEHDFSLDIHILTVLKNAISNPKYQNLSNEEKFCLKIATIFHDIAKPEFQKDGTHPAMSALYARDILNKSSIVLSDEMKNRIFELINNHHWLAAYNSGALSPDELAVIFRRTGDLKIAQIMAEADLKGVNVNHNSYNLYGKALDYSMQKPIEKALDRINAMGQIFLPNKIITPSKIPNVEYKGKTYKVINFKELSADTDLFQLGFEPNTTVDNLRLFIHTVNDNKISNLENVYRLNDSNNQGFICASYVSVQDKPTFGNNKFGVSLYGENVNIANASFSNQGSGSNKDFFGFSEILRGQNSKSAYRKLIPDLIKKELNLSDEEYALLYTKLQKIRYISQLDNIGTITLGEKTFSAKQIKDAIRNADEITIASLKSQHNEVNLYTPKTQAVVAKVNSIEELPQELLNFAHKYNLPIFILGA